MKDTIVTTIYHYSYESRMGGRNYTFEFYEAPFKNLLNLNMNIVIFTHESEMNKIISFFERNNFVDYKIIDYDLNQYFLSDLIYSLKENKKIIDQNGLIKGNPHYINDRNTHLCLSKMDFLNIAISNQYFNSDNYYWIDAGLFHNGLIPISFGGQERYTKPIEQTFWPNNKKNICTPKLISHLNQKNNNQKLLFMGLTTTYGTPTWWNKVCDEH